MFEPPDSFHISAAIGWIELGNYLEAGEELDKISHQHKSHPAVLNIRYAIYAAAKKWGEAAAIATALVEMQPKDPGHWLNLAYAARRKPQGSLAEAKSILEKAAQLFPREPTLFFNLACYDSQLGNLPEAKRWWDCAIETGDKEELEQMMMGDPDLDPLRKEYGLSPAKIF